MPTNDRILLISADCHAGPLPATIRSYVSSKFQPDFDAWQSDQAGMLARRAEHTGEAIYGDEALADFDVEDAVTHGGIDGAWDSKRRVTELDQDGIVAEVIFPGGSMHTVSPFGSGLMTYQYAQDSELWWEGCRSYNRWLRDFCEESKGRRAGVGLITIDDIPRAVAEVRWLRENGVFGGIVLPADTNGNPFYNHPRYEPLWSVCEELEMPIHTHSGWTPNYGRHDGSLGIFLFEIGWFAHRPFHFMVWSGVFERHPRLKFVMTEQGSSWVIDALAQLDSHYELPMFRHLRRQLPKKPSEYYHQNAYIGASFMDDTSAAQRYEIGVDKLMWGSDYPHIEGTWPHTADKLVQAFSDVPRAEAAKMLGETAAMVYGFDIEYLSGLAEQIGPEKNTIGR